MNILILHQWMPLGGVEKVLVNYLKLLHQQGHDVELLLTYDLGKDNFFIESIPESIPYHFVFNYQYYEEKQLLRQKRKISWQARWQYEWLRQRERGHYLRILKNKLRERKFDLVIDFNESLDWFMRLPRCLQPKLPPSIRWVHIQPNGNHAHWNKKTKIKLSKIFQSHKRIIVLCDEMKKQFMQQTGLPEHVFTVLPNPVDIVEVKNKMLNHQGIEPYLFNQPYILQIARLDKQKRHDILLDVYAQLKQHGIVHKLYIIGEGSQKQALLDKIKQLKLDNDCLLLGAYHNPYPFYQYADVFVHTADFEGFPTVLLESMACGTPVVAMDCLTGPKDILGEKSEYGRLIPLYDVHACADAVMDLLMDTDAHQYYVQQSLLRAQHFSMEKIATQLDILLHEIVGYD